MNEQQRRQRDKEGYLIFRNLLSPGQVKILLTRLEEIWEAEGDKAGEENYIEPGVRRLANLANKGEIFRGIYAHTARVDIAWSG